jgi:hypothetical protein
MVPHPCGGTTSVAFGTDIQNTESLLNPLNLLMTGVHYEILASLKLQTAFNQ